MTTPQPYPVIFLPGIMGSALRDEYPIDPETVWSPLKAMLKNYERVTMHPSDLRYELLEPARVRVDRLFDLIYGEFVEELRHNLTGRADQPVPVYPFAYDWRQPLEQAEAGLADFVDEVIDRTRLLRHYHDSGYGVEGGPFPGKVNLVGHSMGGLVISGYLQRCGFGKVAKVATLGTPFRGSLESVAKTTVGVAALGVSPGSSREREAARVTPALYYLLPSYRGAVEAAAGLGDDLFTAATWQPGVVGTLAEFVRLYGVDPVDPQAKAKELLEQMLTSAWKHRTRVERLKLANPKLWLSIVGINTKTRVKIQISRGTQGEPHFELRDEHVTDESGSTDAARRVLTGDTTVPYLGARAKFIPTEQVVCVTPGDFSFWEFKDRALEAMGLHSNLPNMNLCQRLVCSHFLERPQGEIWGRPAPDLPKGAKWDPPIPGLTAR